MVTYYRDESVRVTSELIEVDGQVYRLPELARVWHDRGARSWRALAGRGVLIVAIAGPLVAAVLGIVIALQLRASASVTIAIVGVSALVGLAVGPVADFVLEYVDRSYARGARTLEMWASWRGRPVLLLRTGDALRFGKIYRAVQRALEKSPVS